MSATEFLDTNILVYAFSQTEDSRHQTASTLVERHLEEQSAACSVQVLKEFYVVTTRKLQVPLSHSDATSIISDLITATRVIEDSVPLLRRALDIKQLHSISLWDACIVASAECAGCELLVTEDLSHGMLIEGVRLFNPFRGQT